MTDRFGMAVWQYCVLRRLSILPFFITPNGSTKTMLMREKNGSGGHGRVWL